MNADVMTTPTDLTTGFLQAALFSQSSMAGLLVKPICQLSTTGFKVKPYFAIGFRAISQTASLFNV